MTSNNHNTTSLIMRIHTLFSSNELQRNLYPFHHLKISHLSFYPDSERIFKILRILFFGTSLYSTLYMFFYSSIIPSRVIFAILCTQVVNPIGLAIEQNPDQQINSQKLSWIIFELYLLAFRFYAYNSVSRKSSVLNSCLFGLLFGFLFMQSISNLKKIKEPSGYSPITEYSLVLEGFMSDLKIGILGVLIVYYALLIVDHTGSDQRQTFVYAAFQVITTVLDLYVNEFESKKSEKLRFIYVMSALFSGLIYLFILQMAPSWTFEVEGLLNAHNTQLPMDEYELF